MFVGADTSLVLTTNSILPGVLLYPLRGWLSPTSQYNLWVLLSQVLCVWGGFLLARHIIGGPPTRQRDGLAIVAGQQEASSLREMWDLNGMEGSHGHEENSQLAAHPLAAGAPVMFTEAPGGRTSQSRDAL